LLLRRVDKQALLQHMQLIAQLPSVNCRHIPAI